MTSASKAKHLQLNPGEKVDTRPQAGGQERAVLLPPLSSREAGGPEGRPTRGCGAGGVPAGALSSARCPLPHQKQQQCCHDDAEALSQSRRQVTASLGPPVT